MVLSPFVRVSFCLSLQLGEYQALTEFVMLECVQPKCSVLYYIVYGSDSEVCKNEVRNGQLYRWGSIQAAQAVTRAMFGVSWELL